MAGKSSLTITAEARVVRAAPAYFGLETNVSSPGPACSIPFSPEISVSGAPFSRRTSSAAAIAESFMDVEFDDELNRNINCAPGFALQRKLGGIFCRAISVINATFDSRRVPCLLHRKNESALRGRRSAARGECYRIGPYRSAGILDVMTGAATTAAAAGQGREQRQYEEPKHNAKAPSLGHSEQNNAHQWQPAHHCCHVVTL